VTDSLTGEYLTLTSAINLWAMRILVSVLLGSYALA